MPARSSFASAVSTSTISLATKVLMALLAAYCVWQVVAVDVMVWTTNDTSAYLAHSSDFSTHGAVVGGYRTMGYPLFLRFWRQLSAFLPIDGLFTAVLAQRLLLGVGLLLSVVVLRAWCLPVVIFLANPMTMALTNLVGPEALLMSLSLIFSLVAVVLYRWSVEGNKNYTAFYFLYFLICALYVYMCTVKLTIAPFGLLLAAIWFHLLTSSSSPAGKPQRRETIASRVKTLIASLPGRSWPVSASLVLATVGLGAFLVAATLENRAEYGTTSPAANMERSRFWGAYTLVFSVPGSRSAPALAPYLDGGSPYTYLHGLECIGKFGTPECVRHSYAERVALLNERAQDLIKASGVQPLVLQAQGALAVFAGGRMDDLGSGIRKVMEKAGRSHGIVPTELVDNVEIQSRGIDSFLERYNSGRQPFAIDGVGFPDFLTYHPRVVQLWLLIPILGGLLFIFASRRWRMFGLAALTSFVIFASAMGLGFVDIWRYIIPSWAALAVASMGGLSSLARRFARRPAVRQIADVSA